LKYVIKDDTKIYFTEVIKLYLKKKFTSYLNWVKGVLDLLLNLPTGVWCFISQLFFIKDATNRHGYLPYADDGLKAMSLLNGGM
jgi:hypothetical protein